MPLDRHHTLRQNAFLLGRCLDAFRQPCGLALRRCRMVMTIRREEREIIETRQVAQRIRDIGAQRLAQTGVGLLAQREAPLAVQGAEE